MEINPIQESQLQKLQGLEQLDRIKATPENAIPTDVALDILKATAEIGIDQIVEAIKVNSKNNPQADEVIPTTFNEMLNTTTGNFLQRIAKAYIKPRNPQRTIKLMKALQVDKFLKIVKYCVTDGKGGLNYSLVDSSLNSMVDFATNSTTFNEGIHLSLATVATVLVLPSIIIGDPTLLGLNLGSFLLNTYCVLGQRYNRARLSLTIDKVLKRHKDFDVGRYRNLLGLSLPSIPSAPETSKNTLKV